MAVSVWFREQRQLYIDEQLYVVGFVNRRHLRRKFGISENAAAKDLCLYRRRHPEVSYDRKRKRFTLGIVENNNNATSGHGR